jgi:hypothetical protein
MQESMENKIQLFDMNSFFTVPILRTEGYVNISVRFPSDKQWIDRSLRRKTRQRNLGRNKTEIIKQPLDPLDAELINELRAPESPEVDAAEAKKILSRLSEILIEESPTRESILLLRVPITAWGVKTTHILRNPSESDREEFMDLSGIPTVSQGSIDTFGFNIGGAADLYKKICKEATGYAGPVPVVHQLAAINAAFEFYELEIDGASPNP